LVKLAVNVTDWPTVSVDVTGESVSCAAAAEATSTSALIATSAIASARPRRGICGILTFEL